jgi:hypothetical protein
MDDRGIEILGIKKHGVGSSYVSVYQMADVGADETSDVMRHGTN